MSRIDLKDCTFAIPVRIDSNDRLENLELILSYLNYNFETNIIVVENDKEMKFGKKVDYLKTGDIKYIFQKNDSEIFHRTKILNDILEITETPYWVNYDCDVLFPVKSYIDSVNLMRNGSAYVFPYLGSFHEIPREFIPDIYEKMEVSQIDLSKTGINHPNSLGGAMFLDTEIYKSLGGECEATESWGWEDNIRRITLEKFGYKTERCGTILYHMSHWRGQNSGPTNPFHAHNQNIYYQMCNMSKDRMKNFIDGYNRFNKGEQNG